MTSSIITNQDERFARAAWSAMTEPGDTNASAIVTNLGYIDALDAVTDSTRAAELGERSDGMARAVKQWRARYRAEQVTQLLVDADKLGIHLVDPLSVQGIADLGERAPHLLYVRGDITALDAAQALGWSGARAGSSYGESVTTEIVSDLAQAGITIHSGAAYGIDCGAHRAALAVGGSTVAWMASGADRAYPAGHSQLIERIATAPGSAVVTELPIGAAPTKWRFITRARLLAASTQATIIAEAGWRSGALNTGGQATALGRPLGAVPGPITSACSAGCHRLIREYGATAITSSADARELLQPEEIAVSA
ncbi:DNA-binding protein [Microbacterium sp. CH12i]|uniref:DNA-processing protein DprA n=1 Tax=Microbacterium sp. CH12i TaxID=1479651 RepID=UPI0004612CB5|nr:DNA-processing protein DprA [Microbacterium sp. CH12i]KDA04619.1 DNA-binding protein [Microbacterium sp. CH12i]